MDDDLTDTATSLAHTYTDITAGQRQLSPGALIVVDDAATADPTMLADLAEHAAATGSGLILLDTGSQTWPPKPSQRLLTFLTAELPWATTLDTGHPSPQAVRHTPDPDPAITQARRVRPALLDDDLRADLARAEQLHHTIGAAYQRRLNASWLLERPRDPGHNLEPNGGVELDGGGIDL